jgi:glutathione S-transferase
MRTIIKRMEESLSRSDWLAGGTFSLADIAVATFVDRIDHLLFSRLWDDNRSVQGWIERLQDRPAYHEAKPTRRLPVPESSEIDIFTPDLRAK